MVRFRTRGLRRLVAGVAGSVLALPGTAIVPAAAGVVMHPVVSDFVQMSTSTTPPTQAQCASAGRRCFSPQAIQAAYNVGPLYAQGLNGSGVTIGIRYRILNARLAAGISAMSGKRSFASAA